MKLITRNLMSTRKIVMITVLFILVLISLRMIWIGFHMTPDHPQADHGVLDLRQWNFSDQQTITLDGEWDFYPNQFVKPEATKSSDSSFHKSWIQVPDNWIGSTSVDSAYGFGTYRLRVLINENKQLYSIRIPNIQTASRLFINGQLQKEIGHPTETIEDNKARNIPYSSTFHTNTQELDIVIHVSNYQFPSTGGIIQSIKFGTIDAIANEEFVSKSMQMIVCIALLLHGLYACILYVLGSRRKELLYFGIVVFSMLISTLVDDDKMLLVWIPINLEWADKIKILSYMVSAVFWILFVRNLLFTDQKEKYYHWFASVCALCTLVIVDLPIHHLMQAESILTIVLLLATVLVPILVLRAIMTGVEGAFFLLLSAIGISTNIILGGFLKNRYLIDLPYYPFDLMIAFLSFASFWFTRFSQITIRAEKLSDKLKKADKIKDEFLANTSHELRNPLHGMINMAQTVLVEGRDSLDEKNKSNLELITTLGRRMSLILNDLLDATLLKEQEIRLNKQSVILQRVASGVFDTLRFMTEGKQIELVLDIPEPFPNVIADENRLVQILFNLLHNAIKYTNEGIIVVHSEIQNEMVYVHIKDSGIGIDEETQQRIFQPYEQGDSSMTAMSGGLGLGLSICKQLVELHGGTLGVKSSLDLGSVFTFTLPMDNNTVQRPVTDVEESNLLTDNVTISTLTAASSSALNRSELISDVRRPKVLAVDNDPVNLRILRNILSADHYEITAVTSGKEALAYLDIGEWDLIITDVMMPHMSGYELSRTIREKFSILELPILLLTARSQSEDLYTGFLSGANDYVTKPVGALELKTRVRALTDLKQSVTERLRMEAAWLQAQIQPHFLFNTLNTIASLSDIDTTRMVILLEKFGNYLQSSFDDNNMKRVVRLEHELELVQSYLYIEQERFGDRLQVVWNVRKGITIGLPPLSIQPIVENAVRHGVLTRTRGGTITITISENDNYVEIFIIDDGVGMDEQKLEGILMSHPHKKRGIGLINTNRRLKQIYGRGLQISSVLNQGTTVAFRIPKSHSFEVV
ncbi:hybrid sensor histidine kinase/response regulator [Paenibacillus sp. IHBB 10380]|uniref:hybrid sensor histidine kinase/response regulator n=1 Tax=Paenibacillus sp. IHBB 10380 TaxID=1566358 RepID=UPI000B17BEEA|nr:ATP-binding protein [Paenibacillus sp. IHBB 10380]